MYRLRGHHLLCLLGYRGMGYSKEYIDNMTQLHQTLRTYPETRIQLISGPDELCAKFPKDGDVHCQNRSVFEKDAAILAKMNLQIGQVLRWKDVEMHIRSHVQASDLPTLCENCSWLSYGVCQKGIQRINDGQGLREV